MKKIFIVVDECPMPYEVHIDNKLQQKGFKNQNKLQKFISKKSEDYTIISHGIINQQILFDSNKKIIDTLPLMWYLIYEWTNYSLKEIGERRFQTTDKMQTLIALYNELNRLLTQLYGNNTKRIINYLNFKMEIIQRMKKTKLFFNKEKAILLYDDLIAKIQGNPDIKLLKRLSYSSVDKAEYSILIKKIKINPNTLKKNKEIKTALQFLNDTILRKDIYSQVQGFTKTLRLKHKRPIVMLPTEDSEYGQMVRELFTPPKGYSYIIVDIIASEEVSRRILCKEPINIQEDYYEHYSKTIPRPLLKRAVLSLLNGMGIKTYNETFGNSKEMIDLYYNLQQKKKTIKTIIDEVHRVKILDHNYQYSTWIRNPISGFYHQVGKNMFQIINQSTATYIFNKLIKKVYSLYKQYETQIVHQMHDEIWIKCKTENVKGVIKEIGNTNRLKIKIINGKGKNNNPTD